MLDIVIKGGTVVDGSGAPAFVADVAVRDGRIVAVGSVTEEAARTIDATGLLVTPGWVDVHTHYDGQVTWDDTMESSAEHGVTTLVMGNCGVGFAPVHPSDTDALIDLMEGVEDIPGSALSVGMPWGTWESFAEYLDVIDAREYALDVAAHIAHGPVRFYVMGERGAANEDATADDIAAMSAIVEDALRAGAVGFSTSRTIGHRAKSGRPVPGTYAAEDELLALGDALRRAGHGVFEAIVAGTIGALDGLGGERATPIEELPLLDAVSKASGRPVTFTTAQLFEDPDHWRLILDASAEANAAGAQLRPQVIPRSVTIMTSLDTYHLFMDRPTYLELAHLPLAERVAELRRPEIREAILGEADPTEAPTDFSRAIVKVFIPALPLTFSLAEPVQYEPRMEDSVWAQALAQGKDPVEHMYDLLLEDDGTAFYALLGSNYVGGNLDACREMLLHPDTVTGLGDAGAHVTLISDCSASTFHLTHWARDRTAGERLPVELLVRKLSGANAELYGFADRGTVEVGKRADLNVIDLERLTIKSPELRHDLPTGAARIMQGAEGYVATLVNGVVTRDHDQDTGARPGRLARGTAVPAEPVAAG
ncbi:amidohydrolase family protein [Aquihabitans sp. G128]|uniref:N-acyl-D-amino-acid deacylase family protein n=1 Tax=Aquihabitans sp. G128 TaxID=2849779 RepID=UPI001C24FDAE|nr:amidohydrolase family protein [Aquihabitans sp. G128]QXC63348.1 amidohydrolase family protein [Aquihabitans sp. G128]